LDFSIDLDMSLYPSVQCIRFYGAQSVEFYIGLSNCNLHTVIWKQTTDSKCDGCPLKLLEWLTRDDIAIKNIVFKNKELYCPHSSHMYKSLGPATRCISIINISRIGIQLIEDICATPNLEKLVMIDVRISKPPTLAEVLDIVGASTTLREIVISSDIGTRDRNLGEYNLPGKSIQWI
jgi:hypothetical protein